MKVGGGSPVRVSGPLAPFAAGFGSELTRQGYVESSLPAQLRLMAQFSGWLAQRQLEPGQMGPDRVEEFMVAGRGEGHRRMCSPRALEPLLGYLRGLGVIPGLVTRPARTPAGQVLEDYRRYLAEQRGLRPRTIAWYEQVAQRLLAGGPAGGVVLTRAGVMGFAERACGGRSTGSAQNVLGALRSFLRFAHVTGVIGQELASAVPTVGPVRAGLPRRLDRAEVARLLGSCDRGSRMGRRDFAVLTVLWRLGLRSEETAGLTLEDIDWPVGEIVVRGKGGRCDRLPLPVDVGKALVGYLRRGRPRSTSRVLFLRQRAPHVGMTRQGIASIVDAACQRAGIARVGPHALRHTAATEMLRGGASLTEVAQVLRHRRLLSTTTYTRVAEPALASLARPWLGVRS